MKTKLMYLIAMVFLATILAIIVKNNRLEPIMEENLSALVQYEVFTPVSCHLHVDTSGVGDPIGDFLCCAEVLDGKICTCYLFAFAYLTGEGECLLQQL